MKTPPPQSRWQRRVLGHVYLHHARLTGLLVVALVALGVLGQLVKTWQPQDPAFGPWNIYLANLFASYQQNKSITTMLLHSPDGLLGSANALWQFVAYNINSQFWDPMWQVAFDGLWRVAMLAMLYWTLTARRTLRYNWWVAMAVVLAAIFPLDWQNLLFTQGTSQLMATTVGLLAIHLWISNTSKTTRKFMGMSWRTWAGWACLLLTALCSPAGLLAAPAAGVALLTMGKNQRDKPRTIQGFVILAAGVLLVALVWLTLAGPSLNNGLSQTVTGFLSLLSRPFANMYWPCVLMWLPWAVLSWRTLRGAVAGSRRLALVRYRLLALGIWTLLMMCLLAAGVESFAHTSPWLNASAAVLGPVINSSSLLLLLYAGGHHRMTQSTAASTMLAPRMRPAGHALILGWCLLVAIGLWQSRSNDQGWRRAPARQLLIQNNQASQIHGYLEAGDPIWLTAKAPINQPVNLAIERSWLDQKKIQLILPAYLMPPMRPTQMLAIGQASHPSFAMNEVLLRTYPMGIVHPVDNPHDNSRLGLRYKLQPNQRRFVLSSKVQGNYATDFELYVNEPNAKIALVDRDHPLPKEALAARSLANTPWFETFIFKTTSSQIELDLLRPQTPNPGMFLFTSPLPVGAARYQLERWLGWSKFIWGLGLVILLVTGSSLFFNLGHPHTSTAPKTLPAASVWMRWAPVIAILIAAAAIMFIRKSDALLNPQFWAEDGKIFFADNFNHGFTAIFHPYSGYIHLLPRLVAWISGLITPYQYAPHFYNFATLVLMLASLACYFSRRLPFSVLQKSLLVLAVVLVAQYTSEVYLNITNLQWCIAPLLLLTAFKSPPDARFGSVKWQWTVDILTLVLIGFTGPFIVLVLPFYIVMTIVNRTRYSVIMAAVAGTVAAIQAILIATQPGMPVKGIDPIYPLSWVLPQVIGQRVFKEWVLFGFHNDYLPPLLLCSLLAGVWILVLVIALRHKPLRWPLLFILAFHGLTLGTGIYRCKTFLITLILPTIGRYFYLPLLMLAWIMIILLGSSTRWHRRLAMVVLACMLTTTLQTYFNARPWPDLHWRSYADQIQLGKTMTIPIQPDNLNFTVQLNPQPDTQEKPADDTPAK